MVRFRRILFKLSGGALAGEHEFGFDQHRLEQIGEEILAIRQMGVEVAVMVGGGNIFRGRTAVDWGIERAEADNIGMIATVINSLILRGVLTAKGAGEVRVMSAIPMSSIAEPYTRLRAIHHLEKGYPVIFAGGTGQPYVTTDYPAVQRALEVRADVIFVAKHGVDGIYTADPKKDPAARLYHSADYAEMARIGAQVMDQCAFLLARDYGLPIHLFSAAEKGVMQRICAGERIGTHIGPGVPVVLA